MKQLRACLAPLLLLGLLTGVIYPLAVAGIGQTLFPYQAGGSLIRDAKGTVIGSALIGQNFPGTGYFHGRPSYAGTGYDAANSSGSNFAPSSDDLLKAVHERVAAFKASDGNSPTIPADLVTASGSGLDPDISVAAATAQATRIATARNLPADSVTALIEEATEPRLFGFIGENRVNVLQLNRALDRGAPLGP